jgi:hypothetical protein
MQPKKTGKKLNLEGCRPQGARNDTVQALDWPKDDKIRWVEWRIRELTIERGSYIDERGKWLLEQKAAGNRMLALGDKVAEYAVWLLKERDGLSWHQIAYRFFAAATEKEIETFESRVRRVHNRIERSHPGSKRFKPKPLSEQDKLVVQVAMHGGIVIRSSSA